MFRKLKNPKVVIFSLLAFLNFFVGCEINRVQNIDNKEYGGEEIFDAVFFASGDLAYEIPQIEPFIIEKVLDENLDDRDIILNEIKLVRSLLKDRLKTNSPNIFEEFKGSMYSREYYTMENSFEKVSIELSEAIMDLIEEYESEYIQELDKNPAIKEEVEKINDEISTEMEVYNNDSIGQEALLGNVFSIIDKYLAGYSTKGKAGSGLGYCAAVAVYVVAVFSIAAAISVAVAFDAVVAALVIAVYESIFFWDGRDSSEKETSSNLYKDELITSLSIIL